MVAYCEMHKIYNTSELKLQQNSQLDFPGHFCYFNTVLKTVLRVKILVGILKQNHAWKEYLWHMQVIFPLWN